MIKLTMNGKYNHVPSTQPETDTLRLLCSREDFDADIALYETIMDLHEDLIDAIEVFRNAPTSRAGLLQTLTGHMREARAQDTNAMKVAIVSLLPLDPSRDVVMPPITGPEKFKRGWNHLWTARFLCPLKDRELFEANPHAYMKQVKDGKIKLRAKNLPSFLYAEGTTYSATQQDKGLFRGHVVIRALRLIFTGNSSVFTGHRSASKQSQAEIHDMRCVTPEALAYVCCQIYVNLSTLEQWSTMDSYFDVEKFYKIIIGLFKEPHSRWAKDTLEFLTTELPALKRKVKRKRAALIDDSEAEESDSDPTGILAQQAARLDEDSDIEDMLPIGAPVLLLSRRADPSTPPQSSSPLRQTSVRTQARTQASQTQPHLSPLQGVSGPTQRLHIRLPASNAASTRVQPSQRLQTRPQLSQSSPMRPQNVREPLVPLNGTQGHAIALQSSPVRPAAPRRSQAPTVPSPTVQRHRTLSLDVTDGEEEIVRDDPAPEDSPPKKKRSYRRGAGTSKKRK
ncbi:hypothetical protein BJ912DRAFT_969709, partial [Pholiota molesta]